MRQCERQRYLWAWNLSARVYKLAYIRIAHQIDNEMLAYLGERIVGATIADCGCGPGVVTEKFLQAGAARVVALDSNAAMVAKARALLAKPIASGQVLLCQASYEGDALARVSQQDLGGYGFDIVLFKRSLYMPRPRALLTLRQAVATLRPQGSIVVIHPEQSLSQYAFAPPYSLTSYTPFHLVNRALSRLMEWWGAEEYTLYSCVDLVTLLYEAIPHARVEHIPSQQRPYNLFALHVP